AQPHDRALAELAVDLGERVVERGAAILRGGLAGGLRCSHGVFLPECRESRRGDHCGHTKRRPRHPVAAPYALWMQGPWGGRSVRREGAGADRRSTHYRTSVRTCEFSRRVAGTGL